MSGYDSDGGSWSTVSTDQDDDPGRQTGLSGGGDDVVPGFGSLKPAAGAAIGFSDGEEGDEEKNETNQPAKAPRPTERKPRQGSFLALGLAPPLCARLARRGYRFPTPVQRKVIPAVMGGGDVVAMARTGSGKTAAFLAPIIHKLSTAAPPSVSNGPRAVVLSPTRELAMQTFAFLKDYAPKVADGVDRAVRGVVVVGGEPLEAQFAALASRPDVVVATPGRLLQVLSEMKGSGYSLRSVEVAVFDEADRLFEGGSGSVLVQECMAIVAAMGGAPGAAVGGLLRQTVLISATLPRGLADFARLGLRPDPTTVRLDADRSISPTLSCGFVVTRRDDKLASLVLLLRSASKLFMAASAPSTILFVATRHHVDLLLLLLQGTPGLPYQPDEVVGVHGHMDQAARNAAVSAFRARRAKVLIVTDVAARGIDIPILDLAINYDFPATPKLFVHRCGRVARAGRRGVAVSLVSPGDFPYLLDTLLFLGRPMRTSTNATGSDAAKERGGDDAEESFVTGRLTDDVVEGEAESVRALIARDYDIETQRKSAENAEKLYMRTRARPSGESVRRSKDFLLDGLSAIPPHPWFVSEAASIEEQRTDYALSMKKWRPKQTLLSTGTTMARKRSRLKAAQEQKERDLADDELPPAPEEPPAPTKSMRQRVAAEQREAFYVPLVPSTGLASLTRDKGLSVANAGSMGEQRLEDLVMDVQGEDAEELRAPRGDRLTWDRKKKKYVRDESGQKRSLEDRGTGDHFKKWQKRTRGEDWSGRSDVTGLGASDLRSGKRGRVQSLRGQPRRRTGAAEPELKDFHAIRKEREIKSKNRERHSKKDAQRKDDASKFRANRTDSRGLRKGQAFTRSLTVVRR